MWSKFFNLYKRAINFIGRINTKAILTVFYFTVIPIFRLLSMLVKSDKVSNTNWKIKDNPYLNSHEHPF